MAKTVADIFETLEWGPAPESRSAADEWLDAHERSFRLFIDGEWVEPEGGERFGTLAPANGSKLAGIAQASAGDVDRAVAAARAAQPAWAALGGHGRARYLYAIARGLQKHSRMFSVLETLDNGKPIRESRDIDIPLVARHFYHHAGWAQLFESELAGHEPVGVVGQIIPWNFPLLMLAWKIAPALAMGNTVVMKPAEFTSLTALRFAELCASIGLPNGVVNIVTGDGRTGEAIVKHPDVDKIAFTGSTDVGRIIRIATAGSGKKLSLELGGKSPFIVFDDADLDSAVEGVVDAIWFNQGQVCCAGSRMLMHEGIADRMVAKLQARMEKLRVGDPLDKAVDIGAIIAPVQLERIERLVKQGVEEGATMWQPSWSCPTDGWFYPPTLFTDVSPAATIMQEEIFGPVLVSSTFRTPEEAVELANNTRYGLAASIWTENINLALDVAPRVLAGTVWINCTNVFDAAAGFGGYRESGFGREGGREGLFEYVKPAWMRAAAKGQALANGQVDVPSQGAREGEDSDGEMDESASEGARVVGASAAATLPGIDRTAKLYVAGRQARPDGGYSYEVRGAAGELIGEASLGNRKDIRNAVEAARKAAAKWASASGHLRGQILYYLGENLMVRAEEMAERIGSMTGGRDAAAREVDAAVRRLFTYAAWADKYDGAVHHTPFRNVTLAMPEPLGVMGVIAPDTPSLLGFVSLVGPAIARGNAVVAVPSERFALAATDFYQVLETSDVPAGVVNIVTGRRAELSAVLAAHDDVAGVWYFGADGGTGEVERLSAGNMKRTWVDNDLPRDWYDAHQGEGEEFLREATQVKNIWVPYGE